MKIVFESDETDRFYDMMFWYKFLIELKRCCVCLKNMGQFWIEKKNGNVFMYIC